MCGIIGYVGNEQAAPVVLGGLTRLEYRGYDSAGIATIGDDFIHVGKDKGKLNDVARKCDLISLPGQVGIGHVRWATHGGATKKNAHPHCDNKNQIAVVHNGIIDNYTELKTLLSEKYSFVSETDTEVIPHLVRYYMDSGLTFENAFFTAVKELKGSFAILAVYALEPDKILGARKESPMVVGLGKHANYIGSDILSFLPYTKQYVLIEDGEKIVITSEKVSIFNENGIEIFKKPQTAEIDWEDGNRGDYDHFMLKEIEEQPQAIKQALIQDEKLIMQMAKEIKEAHLLVFVACGTSRHAALIGRYAFSKVGHVFSDVVMGSEFSYFADSIDKNTIVFALSQSGETADVMDGVRQAKANGAKILSIVNVVSSSLARASDKVLYMNCGPEIGVAATKSFTAQLCLLYQIAFGLADRLQEVQEKLRKISIEIKSEIAYYSTFMPELANKLSNKKDFYYIARGVNFAVASEGALKLKEIAYVHAEGMSAGELKHGTLALIEAGTPVIAICPTDYTFDDSMANILEAKARGAYVIGLSDSNSMIFDDHIKIAKTDEIMYPLVTTIPLQILAYYSALTRGLDPDKPRNLAKSVTVK
ncbi:MAG: glutamine--fructose-6-phosphate transaminase (isomerizing) [Dehalococcoidales bacterium]